MMVEQGPQEHRRETLKEVISKQRSEIKHSIDKYFQAEGKAESVL